MTAPATPPAEADGLYRKLPQLGEAIRRPEFTSFPHTMVVAAARSVLAGIRQRIAKGEHTEASLETEIAHLPRSILAALHEGERYSLRPVINATGVVLHTNLGRAPLSEAAIRNIAQVAGGYCNLELDLASGERSRRDEHVERLILRVAALRSGQDADAFARSHGALVVNNCAAATYLALNSLAEGGEVIISRGELVEIGGGFRIPDILRKSGCILREVGTTNRTRVADYEAALSPNTRLILRVHPSNFSMEGFTERPALSALVALSRQYAVPLFEDQGTGCLVDLADYGVPHQASLIESIRGGPDLIAASGDKLMGGPQCGVLLGRRELIDKVLSNPLLRAFRVDKLTYAALEATLFEYLAEELQRIPVVRMLREDPEVLFARSRALADSVAGATLQAELMAARSVIGGGTTPGASLPSFAVALHHSSLDAKALAVVLRRLDPPVISRIREDRVLLDLRTVPAHMDGLLASLLKQPLESFAAAAPEPGDEVQT